jgi:aspartate beta-hydroxylase
LTRLTKYARYLLQARCFAARLRSCGLIAAFSHNRWAEMATDLIATGPAGIGSPVFDPSGELFVVCMPEGSIMKVDAAKGELSEVDTTGGQPAAMAIDTRGAAHVADLAMGAVMHRMSLPGSEAAGEAAEGAADASASSASDAAAWVTSVVEYEGEPLRGPSSVAIDSSGTLFFTDSGPLGDTTLEQPRGSVFCVTGSGRGRYLKPLILKSLAHPCAVAIGTTDNVV